ncbi:MAG: pyrroline-5-carboxylate reductase [Myxococcales bacterium]|nr:pyrroline-5-carboxylate reductase [Myxococcales bacterium]MCB9708770.1 pyrroline-5-carboxylate reductase [Myxococcales bacterium]
MDVSAHRIAFIGAGNMAQALIKGMISDGSYAACDITASDVRQDLLDEVAGLLGIQTVSRNAEAVKEARCVVIAVKPARVRDVLREIAPHLPTGALIISIAAGIRIASLARHLPPNVPIVRAMPNTPALVGQGATGISAGPFASEADMAIALALFDSVGTTITVSEAGLDAVTALSGSGPGYVFRFIEVLIEAGVANGLSPESSRELVIQTVQGAVALLLHTKKSPEVLRAEVSSPGGTTLAGLDALHTHGFAEAVRHAVAAARQRALTLDPDRT